MAKKNTGLGSDAFFQAPSDRQTRPETISEPIDSGTPGVEESPDDKVRTTLRLHLSTMNTIDLLKIHARKAGKKPTYAEILGEAVELLAREKGIDA